MLEPGFTYHFDTNSAFVLSSIVRFLVGLCFPKCTFRRSYGVLYTCCLEAHKDQIQVFDHHFIDRGFRITLQLEQSLSTALYQATKFWLSTSVCHLHMADSHWKDHKSEHLVAAQLSKHFLIHLFRYRFRSFDSL